MIKLLSSTLTILPATTIYDTSQATGVTAIAISGGLSALAILLWLAIVRSQSKTYRHTHIFAYYVSLIAANTLQAAGTLMNFQWVALGYVISGPYCSAQGGIKQAGNVGTALWSFMIALHLFNLLFLRWKSTLVALIVTLISGWTVVAVIIFVGPGVIQTMAKGSYFGVSGSWCWITDNYPHEQVFLEYFFEFLSAGVSFLLYVAVLLRVRGNLVVAGGRWCLQFVPRGESWRLQIGRDVIDASMLRVAAQMVWYPVAYSVILIPISLTRLTEFAGHTTPFWAIVVSDSIYSLTGFVNVALLLLTTRFVPDTSVLPLFTTRRKNIDPSSTEAMGYTPFVLPMLVVEDETKPTRWSYVKPRSSASDNEDLQQSHPHTSQGSHPSASTDLSEYLHRVSDESRRSGFEGKSSCFSV